MQLSAFIAGSNRSCVGVLDGKPTVIVEEHEGSRLLPPGSRVRSGIEECQSAFRRQTGSSRLVVGRAAFDQLGNRVIFRLCGIERRLIFLGSALILVAIEACAGAHHWRRARSASSAIRFA
ncbi:hypothetical protein BMJ34_29640 [Sinorhizobium medicae]|uniref:Uncharacterized protein n=1 Tax=Sinorhizobium medicae TaxID=110321 RepID=A0ABX4TS24_9HYPH|nr:hypothetical protein [Sinorhizobium medicae]MDX0451703.1 hypothetical protein [Sinorhizobium medicae]MDX0519092.1 hypothetical protein [Sinorhizobium medicae]MDX0568579.1 hypothetical protein [Sinorhizobium medicae]MDX0581233.1 hypothetical protein [Sinorhizobium medicae]MDX0729493.1 hypothetical protein [Sinorhizobium medicae]